MTKSDEKADNSVIAVNKAGRPTKYTPDTVARLLAALADGLTQEQACLASGIGKQTLSDWLERHPELEPRLAEAREQARRKALAGIRAAGEAGDWRALESFLKLSFQADYRQGGNNNNINVTAQAGMQLVCDEPTRARLIELNRKLLEGGEHALPKDTEPNDTDYETNSIFQTSSI
jgi:predicted Zn-dependent protease